MNYIFKGVIFQRLSNKDARNKLIFRKRTLDTSGKYQPSHQKNL